MMLDDATGQDVPDAFLDALQVYWTLKQAFSIRESKFFICRSL